MRDVAVCRPKLEGREIGLVGTEMMMLGAEKKKKKDNDQRVLFGIEWGTQEKDQLDPRC